MIMNHLNNIKIVRPYNPPQIERVMLDNEISLAMESYPPTHESENVLKSNVSGISNPFKFDINS
jgi:hypothetical protein